MKKIVIASLNPVKLNAALEWFRKCFPKEQFAIQSMLVDDAAPQPISYKSTYDWAKQRALYASNMVPEGDYFVGIEWWTENSNHLSYAYVCIISKEWKEWSAKSGEYELPERVSTLMDTWLELWEADDIVFWDSNSKQKNWSVGILTKNVITREHLYTDTVCLSLIPFMNPTLY